MPNSESGSRFHRSPLPASRTNFHLRLAVLTVAGLLAAMVAGCATGEFSLVATVSGGETLRVPLAKGGPRRTEEGGIKVERSDLLPNFEKKEASYLFEFSDARARALQSVKVEDVSEETPFLLVEDAKPELNKGRWRGSSRSLGAADPCLKWVMQLDNTLRVYRLTIAFADGSKLVLHQGATYPNVMKVSVRSMFGEKY